MLNLLEYYRRMLDVYIRGTLLLALCVQASYNYLYLDHPLAAQKVYHYLY